MEVIARLDRAIHVGDIDAVSLWLRRILLGGSEKAEDDNSNKFKGGTKKFLGGSHSQGSTGHLPRNAGPHSRRGTKQEGSTTAEGVCPIPPRAWRCNPRGPRSDT